MGQEERQKLFGFLDQDQDEKIGFREMSVLFNDKGMHPIKPVNNADEPASQQPDSFLYQRARGPKTTEGFG